MEKKKIVIYGAGDYGKRLHSFLKKHGLFVDYFCQTNVEESDSILGTPLISMDELRLLDKNLIILIAIGDKNASKKIKSNLLRLFLDTIEIYECGDFITENLSKVDGESFCLICGSFVKEFTETGKDESIFKQKHIIGGGYRKNAMCPVCASMDRERWLYHVLSKYTGIFNEKCSVLHFAPEYNLMKKIRENASCDYYSCDIEQGRAMHIVDVTNIQFKDDFFDYIIINHVLEHIKNEKSAIKELKRVLKPTGKLIMSFPICMDQKTFEDEHIVTPEECLKFYGQEDHVRLYGYDYEERIKKFGLEVYSYSPKKELSKLDVDKYGFIQDDILMICQKE